MWYKKMIDKKKMDEIIAGNAFASYLGMELVEVGPGYARGRLRMERHHMNIYEGMHGGCVYALADTVAGVAAGYLRQICDDLKRQHELHAAGKGHGICHLRGENHPSGRKDRRIGRCD